MSDDRTLYEVNVLGSKFYGITKTPLHVLMTRFKNNLGYQQKRQQLFYTVLEQALSLGKEPVLVKLKEGNRTKMIRERNALIMDARSRGISLNSIPAEKCK